MEPIKQIRAVDYSVIFARDVSGMKAFYRDVMKFPLIRELGEAWIEFQVGANTLALANGPGGGMFNDDIPAKGTASLQLAFRVAPDTVNACAEYLKSAGVTILSGPTDQAWGHRTLFFRDPDHNLLEIYAEI